MSVRLSVRMNAEISETIRARLLRFGVQIPDFSVECHAHSNAHKPPKTVAPTVLISAECHAHSNAHKPLKPVTPTIFMLDIKF